MASTLKRGGKTRPPSWDGHGGGEQRTKHWGSKQTDSMMEIINQCLNHFKSVKNIIRIDVWFNLVILYWIILWSTPGLGVLAFFLTAKLIGSECTTQSMQETSGHRTQGQMNHQWCIPYIPSKSMSVWRFDVNLCLFELGYLKFDGWSSLSLRRWGQLDWGLNPLKLSDKTQSIIVLVMYPVSHHNSIWFHMVHIPLSPYHMVSSPIVSFHSSRLQPVRCCPTVFSSSC